MSLVKKAGALQKDVTTAATAVALSASKLIVTDAIIKAKAANTNDIYVGGSDVDAASGYVLDATNTVRLRELMGPAEPEAVFNLADVYIDADTDGEGVSVLYFENSTL